MGPRIWLIAGPTASGKSTLALRLAEEHGGEILGADSMQIYHELPVLTASPTPLERQRVPHHLIGVAEAARPWSVGVWLRAALEALEGIARQGRPAIVVGGTGLYFNALTKGLAIMPPVSLAAREAASQELAEKGEAAFRARLSIFDPEGEARIAPGDRQRLVRAASVIRATGRSLGDWQVDTVPPLPAQAWRGIVLDPPKADLYPRIDARLEAMVASDALDEVRALLAEGIDPEASILKAFGVRELAAHLQGETSLEQAIAAAQRATRNYAKRQATWFRNQTPDWPRIETLDADAQWARAVQALGIA